MIKYFKVNDPYRLAILAIAFIIIRFVIFYFGHPLTQVELKYFLAARTIADGKWLYKEILDTTEPLSALFFYLLPPIPHSFTIFSYWINVLILISNAVYANQLLQKLDIFSDKSYLPALFYFLISLTFLELNVVSPALLASTPLLFVLSSFFSYLKKEDVYHMYETGFYLGIASLFYLPVICFIPPLLATLLFFTRSSGRPYFLILTGFSFPWILTGILYLWINGLEEFFVIFIQHYFTSFISYTDSFEIYLILILPVCLFISAIFFSKKGIIREINFQSVSRKFMILWFLGGLLSCLISPVRNMSLLYIIIFPLSFFYTYYHLQIKAGIIPGMIILLFAVLAVYFQYRCVKGTIWQKSLYQITVSQQEDSLLTDKKIWIAGSKHDHYLNGKIAGKYLNWDVSQDDFENLDKFFAVENIRLNLYSDIPEVIIDQSSIMPALFKRLPYLGNHYKQNERGFYILQR